MNDKRRYVYVCLNEDCCKRGSRSIHTELSERCGDMGDVEIREYICFGNCDYGANAVVFPDRVWFSGLRADDASAILNYLHGAACAEQPKGDVDDELAETVWELLEIDISDAEQSIS